MSTVRKTQGKETFFVSQIDRFGYTLFAFGRTKREAETALLNEYQSVYKDINGTEPDEDLVDWPYSKETYYSLAKTEMFTEEVEFGEVVWW